jgi:hypothetical protein
MRGRGVTYRRREMQPLRSERFCRSLERYYRYPERYTKEGR